MVLTTGTWRLRKHGKGNLDCLVEGAERRRRGTESSAGSGVPQHAGQGEREEPRRPRKGSVRPKVTEAGIKTGKFTLEEKGH